MTERRPPGEIPDTLATLVRYVTVGFYSVECQLIMELMSYYRRITEDDMAKLLQFDKKQFRSAINILKQDKFIYSRIMLETGPDNKATRQPYYYVDYGVFINVVKYKLHHVRTKVEAMERDATSRAAFHCPNCYKNYTDLEAGQLFDALSQTFKCTYCFTEVEEDLTKDGTSDSRKLMAMFNEQMAPIFSVLQTLDGVKLSDILLEPPPVKDSKNSKSRSGDKVVWSGEATRNVTISREESVAIGDTSKQQRAPREIPSWIKNSAIDSEEAEDNGDKEAISSPLISPAKEAPSVDKDIIMKTLLSHERRVPLSETQSDKVTIDRTAKSSQEPDSADEFSDDEGEFTVTLGGRKVPYNDITADMVARMTEFEREEYIRVGREMHEFYDS